MGWVAEMASGWHGKRQMGIAGKERHVQQARELRRGMTMETMAVNTDGRELSAAGGR